MQIIRGIKQIAAELVARRRRESSGRRGDATEAAEELWYEGQHETAPVGDSDTGSTPKPPATPKRRRSTD